MNAGIKRSIVDTILNYLIKAIAATLLCMALLAGMYWLCRRLQPRLMLETYLLAENCLQSVVQLLPRIGNLAGSLLYMLGISEMHGNAVPVSAVSEALFGLLLLGIYQCTLCFFAWVKHYADKICKANGVVCIAVDGFCTLLLLLTSAVAAVFLHGIITTLFPADTYWIWAAIMGIIIIVIVLLTIWHRSSSRLLHVLLNLLLDIVAVFLIYLVFVTGSCISGIEYLLPGEVAACTVVFILSLLGLVLLMSYQFSSLFNPL